MLIAQRELWTTTKKQQKSSRAQKLRLHNKYIKVHKKYIKSTGSILSVSPPPHNPEQLGARRDLLRECSPHEEKESTRTQASLTTVTVYSLLLRSPAVYTNLIPADGTTQSLLTASSPWGWSYQCGQICSQGSQWLLCLALWDSVATIPYHLWNQNCHYPDLCPCIPGHGSDLSLPNHTAATLSSTPWFLTCGFNRPPLWTWCFCRVTAT